MSQKLSLSKVTRYVSKAVTGYSLKSNTYVPYSMPPPDRVFATISALLGATEPHPL